MEIKELYREALQRGVCHLFTGRETIGELCALFTTPQGLEFYAKKQWPSLVLLRTFDAQTLMSYNIYVDAGQITLRNTEKVVLVGCTSATLTFDDQAEMCHLVAVMHGASANITASSYAVVRVQDLGGAINIETKEHAIIL